MASSLRRPVGCCIRGETPSPILRSFVLGASFVGGPSLHVLSGRLRSASWLAFRSCSPRDTNMFLPNVPGADIARLECLLAVWLDLAPSARPILSLDNETLPSAVPFAIEFLRLPLNRHMTVNVLSPTPSVVNQVDDRLRVG